MHRSLAVPFCAALATSAAFAQQQYPEGAPIPRSLTALERAWLAAHPLAGTDAPTPPPTGPVHCAAEYEPCDGLVIAWEGSSSWTAILAQIAYHVTTTGNANIYCYVDSTSERSTVQTTLNNAGCLRPHRGACRASTRCSTPCMKRGPNGASRCSQGRPK